MRVAKRTIILTTIVAVAGAWYFTRDTAEAGKSPSPVIQTVRTAVAQEQSMPIMTQANGYVTALNTVDVRPQIQSIVRAVHVREGQNVRAGDLLFTLDDRSAASNVAKAEAELASIRSDLKDAELSLERNKNLLEQKFVAQSAVDSARVKVDTLRSSVAAASAALESSRVSLSHHEIRAAISGRIGAINLYPGSLAQSSGDAMVNIAQIDPIAVSFALPERELASIVATYPDLKAPVTAVLQNGTELQGKLIFIDNTSDAQSGTIKMKAEFPNKDRKLWPGTYVNVHMMVRDLQSVVVIPAQAVINGPQGRFVYVVQADGTVKNHPVTIEAIEKGQAAVSGVTAGSRVVSEGMQHLRPGSAVREHTPPAGAPVASTSAGA